MILTTELFVVLCLEGVPNPFPRKPCGIRAARKLRVVRRNERWADKVISDFHSSHCLDLQEGTQHLFD